jgi:hypothetical protein
MFFIIKAISGALSSESWIVSKLEIISGAFPDNNFVNALIPFIGVSKLHIDFRLLPEQVFSGGRRRRSGFSLIGRYNVLASNTPVYY